MEDVFDGVQEGRFALSPDICDALYDALDVIQVYTSGGEAEPETVEAVRGQLRALAAAGQPASPDQENGQRSAPAPAKPKPKPKPARPSAPVEPAAPARPVPAPPVEAVPAPSAAARATEDTVRVSLAKLDQLMGQASELLIAGCTASSAAATCTPCSRSTTAGSASGGRPARPIFAPFAACATCASCPPPPTAGPTC
jgi:chemotaxis protein histidine kinase CheA